MTPEERQEAQAFIGQALAETLAPLNARLAVLEARLQSRPATPALTVAALRARVDALEGRFQSGATPPTPRRAVVAQGIRRYP